MCETESQQTSGCADAIHMQRYEGLPETWSQEQVVLSIFIVVKEIFGNQTKADQDGSCSRTL